MTHGLCELLWIKRVLEDLGIECSKPILCDNRATIQITQNPVQHDRTKHVEIDRHFIREKLDQKIIRFPFVKFENQLADILTMAVSGRTFNVVIDKLGLIDIYAPT